MGLDRHAKDFIAYIAKKKDLGSTLTLGRQNDFTGWINPETGNVESYCEPMLQQLFGATKVESVDASDYEGSTFTQDLNEKWESSHDLARNKYFTILDLGTLEHVFNVPQALESIAEACEVGGRIIHVQTHSDFCGHGFWQFSAELFFSWYTEINGFGNVEIFIAPLGDPNSWFRCLQPDAGDRCELSGRGLPMSYILVSAQKIRDVPRRTCQQSDYVAIWNDKKSSIINPSDTGKSMECASKTPAKILHKLYRKAGSLAPLRIKRSLHKHFNYLKPWWKSRYLIKEDVKLLMQRS